MDSDLLLEPVDKKKEGNEKRKSEKKMGESEHAIVTIRGQCRLEDAIKARRNECLPQFTM